MAEADEGWQQQAEKFAMTYLGYLKLREACELTGLHANTLRRYADNGLIPSIRTATGQR